MEKKYLITSIIFNILYWLPIFLDTIGDKYNILFLSKNIFFYLAVIGSISLFLIFFTTIFGLIYIFFAKKKKIVILSLFINLSTIGFISWTLLSLIARRG